VVCCGVLWCAVVCCGVLWCAVVCCGVLWCAVVCCGVLWCTVVRSADTVQAGIRHPNSYAIALDATDVPQCEVSPSCICDAVRLRC
jgi:hypothetical protein